MTADQQSWPEELRDIVYSTLYGKRGMGPDGPAVVEHLLSVIDASPYRIVDTRTHDVVERASFAAAIRSQLDPEAGGSDE